MVEVPSVALMADVFAPHVDFFSIGANDLTQYTLAIDRGHAKLAALADSLNPAVLRLVEMTCEAANKNGIWVGVCGGIASDIIAVPILIGLGVTELSVSIPMIPKVKAAVRRVHMDQCKALAKKAVAAKNAKEVRNLKL
jgi:phosphocarrier protein FPr